MQISSNLRTSKIRISILILLTTFCISLYGQREEYPFTYVENMPSFPGGMEAINSYLKNNVIYPAEAKQHKIKGKVFIQFVVKKDGSTTGAKVETGLGYGCDEEAIRVVNKMNQSYKWSPGTHNGLAEPVILAIPVRFQKRK